LAEVIEEPISGKDYFLIQINVSNFRPEELKVTVIENQVVIEGKHDEKSDNYGQVIPCCINLINSFAD
jgi:HSP20 family molecular chaperone IbpA